MGPQASSASSGLCWTRFVEHASPDIAQSTNLETAVIQPGRAEKRLHRALRRMQHTADNTGKKTPAHPPYAGLSDMTTLDRRC
jgi:hypothetical protein